MVAICAGQTACIPQCYVATKLTSIMYNSLFLFYFVFQQGFSLVIVMLCVISDYPATACDCDYHSGGCSISKPATPGNACKCSYKGFYTCKGSQTGCRDASSKYCKRPDTSIQSCFQGGGDCGGYQAINLPAVAYYSSHDDLAGYGMELDRKSSNCLLALGLNFCSLSQHFENKRLLHPLHMRCVYIYLIISKNYNPM